MLHVRKISEKETNLTSSWSQVAGTKLMKSALFRNITQRIVVILYWRFGTTYRSHLSGSKI